MQGWGGVSGASEFIEKEKFQKQIDINLMGAIETSRLATKYLKTTGGGKIFFTSSVAGFYSFAISSWIFSVKSWLKSLFTSARFRAWSL